MFSFQMHDSRSQLRLLSRYRIRGVDYTVYGLVSVFVRKGYYYLKAK